ncbi:GNAT family N-acetyltransferase [Ferrimonas sp. SCSIO 43195]|uniref:GNAT family N-acetyltransferase n=1 Tax=Ferrimonas sp. SCSIO 43195 TaxID=2822844 RepID=UPI002074F455|nr:GNAT family N-acetyltransferase [Ferrimonas sp. SCSIO 43195]USD36333.1 N-acetyltransferase [Ferrimonas sp. SCSIO 43195]
MPPPSPFELQWLSRIDQLSAEQWDALFTDAPPFCRYAFLHALELSGCVGGQSGWMPYHLCIRRQGQIVALAPGYLKRHSYGEYVFDWSWADAYQHHGLAYYPKWISAVPFSPVTGPRLALAPGIQRQALLAAITPQLHQHGLALGLSGMQWLFPGREESLALSRQQWRQRLDIQFHWHNRGYANFEQFTDTLTARRRKAIRKERRCAEGLSIERFEGASITPALWQQFFLFYQLTYAKRSGHGGYLNQAFFDALGRTLTDNLVLIMARRGSHWLAGALYLKHQGCLYGRYWGCSEAIDDLHFELCYYQGIDYCIDHRLSRFDAGAQGEHKLRRGFEPTLTYSNHWVFQPQFDQAIAAFVDQETERVQQRLHEYRRLLPFKST